MRVFPDDILIFLLLILCLVDSFSFPFTSTFCHKDSRPVASRNRRRDTRSPLFSMYYSTEIQPLLYKKNKNNEPTINLIFPGGGIFFYWQAGVITYLREKNYPIMENPNIQFTGASAGALCATLTATGVNMETATSLALEKCREARVWERPLGLYGIWGGIIDEWLDELLPCDGNYNLLNQVNDKVSIVVTQVPSFEKKKICKFESRMDLIKANRASVHIPLFLDGKWTTTFRDMPHIDGSFWINMADYHKNDKSLVLDWKQDPLLRDRTLGDAVKALNEDGIWDLMEKGRNHAVVMEQNGHFDLFL